MSAPGYLRAAWIVAAKDLRLEWRTWEALASSVVFSLIVLVVFNFGFGFATVRRLGAERLVPGVIWVALAFATVVSLARSMQIERRRDTLSALFLAPIDRSAVLVGKLTANLAKVTVLQWIVLPLSAIFFDYDLVAIALPMLAVLFLHAFGLTVLGTLFAAVVTRLRRGEALLATLLFPASTPVFLSAVKCSGALLEGKSLSSSSNWLGITAGFNLLYLVLAVATFEFVLEE